VSIEDLIAQNLELRSFPRERLRLDAARLTLFVFSRCFPHVDHRLVGDAGIDRVKSSMPEDNP
jgi:hypothetical protein